MYTADASRLTDYAPARKTLTVFAVITIVFLVVTIIVACWCTHNFNKGLKPHVSKSSRIREEAAAASGDKMYMNDVRPSYAETSSGYPPQHMGGGSRMEID
jgi:hypothetical protein